MGQQFTPEQLTAVAEWLDMPVEERPVKTVVAYMRRHRISDSSWYRIKEFILEKRKQESQVGDFEATYAVLKKRALEGRSPKDMEMWLKFNYWLKDRQEVRVDLSIDPDDFARANLAAIRELEEREGGVVEVPPQPALLPEELCEDSGQDGAEGDNLGRLATPREPSPIDRILDFGES